MKPPMDLRPPNLSWHFKQSQKETKHFDLPGTAILYSTMIEDTNRRSTIGMGLWGSNTKVLIRKNKARNYFSLHIHWQVLCKCNFLLMLSLSATPRFPISVRQQNASSDWPLGQLVVQRHPKKPHPLMAFEGLQVAKVTNYLRMYLDLDTEPAGAKCRKLRNDANRQGATSACEAPVIMFLMKSR